MKIEWKTLGLIFPWLLVATFIVYASLTASYIIRNSCNIHTLGVEVYFDQQCTKPCTHIYWGTLYPGETVEKQVYIKLTGNTPATLSMSLGNWMPPEAGNFITVTWNYDERILEPSEVLPITLTLTVDQTIADIEKFTFDIIITAIG